MHKIKQFTAALLFLTVFFGKETKLTAQSHLPDFSNWILTTDCCPIEKNRIDSIMNNAPFVFEGRMIKESRKGSFQSYLFEIEKVYRGNERLQAGTVEIIAKIPDNSWELPLPSFSSRWHIIFAKETDMPSSFDANNVVKLEVFYHDYFHVTSFFAGMPQYTVVDGTAIIDGISYYRGFSSVNFKTQKEARDFLASYSLSPTNIPKADTLKNLSKREIEEAKRVKEKKANEKIIPYVSPAKMDSAIREMKRRHGLDIDTVQNRKTNKTQKGIGEKLYVTLDSIKHTINSGDRYLEFDIKKNCILAKNK